MAEHVIFLFLLLLFFKSEAEGVAVAAVSSGEDPELMEASAENQQVVLPFKLFPREEHNVQEEKEDLLLRLCDRGLHDVKLTSVKEVEKPQSGRNTIPMNHKKMRNLTIEDVGVTIDHSQAWRSNGNPPAESGTSVGGVQPKDTHDHDAKRPRRRRRSWLWNQFFVIEEYQGPEPVLIGRLHTDMDKGDGRTKYTLEGEGVGSVFVIDGSTGNIHVTKALDREEKDQYRLIATATSRESGRALEPSSEFIIRVQDINDNPPVFPNEPYVATVPEMAHIGTSILQVTASDADDPTYGNSARLVYAITQGHDYFSVDPETGILRTAVPDMDRETQDEYLLVLLAKDMGGHLGGLSGTTTVTVKLSDVNDNPPHFRRSAWSFSVSELAAPGVEVGRLTASDADLGENAQLEFSILDGEEAQIFNVTGKDKEAVIVLNKLLDYESRNSYTFSMEVANPLVDPRYLRRGPFKDQATVRVMVLNADEPPRFSQAVYHLDVSENCPPMCSVGRVSALDPDTGKGSNIRYSIDPQSDPEALFRISSDTGVISTVMELDREQEQWHNITAMATQRDNPNLVSRVVVAIETLDQNDNAPELDRQYSTSVCDSSAPGQVIQVLRAVDKDDGGQDAPIHFSIPPESGSALNLSIRESGGVTASLVLQSALETRPGFSSSLVTLYVPVVLRDVASGLTNTGTVTVTVCPCLGGGMHTEDKGRPKDRRWERQAVCVPAPAASPSLIFSLVTLMAMLACVTTLLVVCALSLSLRHQKRDSHSPFEDDDVRENIISYDDEGGGEADTAAFDIAALQSMHRFQHLTNNRNIWYTQQNLPRTRTYSWSRHAPPNPDPLQRPGSAPLYGRLCYGLHTLPVLRDYPRGPLEAGVQLTPLAPSLAPSFAHSLPTVQLGHSQLPQNTPSFEPLLSPETSPGSIEEELMMLKSRTTARLGQEANRVNGKEEGPLKIRTTESDSRADPDLPSDSASSILSVSEQNCSHSSHNSSSAPPVYLKGDTYSIVGSLNPNSRGACVNGTGGASLLNPSTLHRKSLPLPGAMLGSSWGYGAEPPRTEASAPKPLQMEDLLKIRLDQVTFDLSQPPYDSLQTYEFEGRDSRAESLSSLESDGEKDSGRVMGGMEELNQKFQKLVEIIREREREKNRGGGGGGAGGTEGGQTAGTPLNESQKQSEDEGREPQRWDF